MASRRWPPGRGLLLRLLGLWGGLLVVLAVPLPGNAWLGPAVQGAGALVLVCWSGKLLYDTLFYDRRGP